MLSNAVSLCVWHGQQQADGAAAVAVWLFGQRLRQGRHDTVGLSGASGERGTSGAHSTQPSSKVHRRRAQSVDVESVDQTATRSRQPKNSNSILESASHTQLSLSWTFSQPQPFTPPHDLPSQPPYSSSTSSTWGRPSQQRIWHGLRNHQKKLRLPNTLTQCWIKS